MQNNDLISGKDGQTRCAWCGSDPLYIDYHDNEWGRPVYDGVRLFEKLCLEGFQSGLSWITILKKRENFRSCLLYTSPSPRDQRGSRMPSSA